MTRTIRVGDRIQAERVTFPARWGDVHYDRPAPTHWGTVRQVYGSVVRIEWDCERDPRSGPELDVSVAY